jgi:hypothetical protein
MPDECKCPAPQKATCFCHLLQQTREALTTCCCFRKAGRHKTATMTRDMSDDDPATDPDHQKVRLRCQAELKPITNKEWLRPCVNTNGRSVPCEVLENRLQLYGDALACRESRGGKSTSANGLALLPVNRRARSEGAAGHIFVWHRHHLTDAGTPDGRFLPIRFGPSLTDAAPCTFLHDGRIADIRCVLSSPGKFRRS